MARKQSRRDNTLLDALDAIEPVVFNGTVWRVVRENRDPLLGSASAGRWNDGTFDVLYTAQEADGARAEMYFHIRSGQPVFPSQMDFRLFKLQVGLSRALKFVEKDKLATLGVDFERFGVLEYHQKDDEYPRSQEIAEAAHFLNFDGLIVPSARWHCDNVVLFIDRISPSELAVEENHGVIDWNAFETTLKSHL